jgi:hypothetical protein
MLSAEQKKLKEKIIKTIVVSSPDSSFSVRPIFGQYDSSRVAELWANLSMVQQLQGNEYWLNQFKLSNLSWNDFIEKTISKRSYRVVVLENDEVIFGFAYMSLTAVNLNNPKKPNQLKAIIKEVYLEPGFRSKVNFDELGEMMRNCLMKMGVDLVEIDVKL